MASLPKSFADTRTAGKALAQSLLPEFDQEMANTRKTLERVPDDKLEWRPHPKSGTMGWLAGHLAILPNLGKMVMTVSEFDLSSPRPRPEFRSSKEVLAAFDQNVSNARAAISALSDADAMAQWKLKNGDKTIFALPRIAVLRTMLMSHMIHHRAQLGVYLRLNDVPVPSIYGPSADEGNF